MRVREERDKEKIRGRFVPLRLLRLYGTSPFFECRSSLDSSQKHGFPIDFDFDFLFNIFFCQACICSYMHSSAIVFRICLFLFPFFVDTLAGWSFGALILFVLSLFLLWQSIFTSSYVIIHLPYLSLRHVISIAMKSKKANWNMYTNV